MDLDNNLYSIRGDDLEKILDLIEEDDDDLEYLIRQTEEVNIDRLFLSNFFNICLHMCLRGDKEKTKLFF